METQQITIHPYLLTFSDTSLEREYHTWQNKNYCFVDRCFCYLNLVMYVVLLKFEQHAKCKPQGIVLVFVSALSYAIQLVLMEIHKRRYWVKHRLEYIFLFRCCRIILLILGIPFWASAPGFRPTPIKSLLIFSGTIYKAWHGLGSPVVFRYHLLIQIPLTIMILFCTSWPQCDTLATIPQVLNIIHQIKKFVRF